MAIGRRRFISALGGAAAAWPLAARAQQSDRLQLIGVLMGSASNDQVAQDRLTAFRNSFQGLGWTEGRNVRIEVRWAGVDFERGNAYAAELIALAPDVIVASPNLAVAALSRLTRTIPIVMPLVGDPVGSGFVTNLARPGGNITGFNDFEPAMAGKWLQLLKEIAPRVSRVAVFVQPETTTSAAMWRAVEGSGPSLSIEVNSAAVHDASEIEHAITTFAAQANGGLIVLPGPVGTGHRDLIIALAARHRLPAIYPFRYFAAAGGLISYGPDSFDLFRRTALYVDRILKGEKPGDLPVQNPTKFEFVINMKTANALGLTVPQSLLVAADEVIE